MKEQGPGFDIPVLYVDDTVQSQEARILLKESGIPHRVVYPCSGYDLPVFKFGDTSYNRWVLNKVVEDIVRTSKPQPQQKSR